jgi:hypothetical protein
MAVLATHSPLTSVWPTPQPKATRVIMVSGLGIGAGVIACADVAANKTKIEPVIDLIILLLPQLRSQCPGYRLSELKAWEIELNQWLCDDPVRASLEL